MRMKKTNERGITLISLVITIVVLLILAGVAISIAVDSDGLFSKAGEAANNWDTAVKAEEQTLDDLLYELDKITELTDMYVTLYSDGTLAFSNSEETIEEKTVLKSYGNIKGEVYPIRGTPWYEDRKSITSVTAVNEVKPISTELWFIECSEIVSMDLAKLNTSLVTSMKGMFYNCAKLTSLDLSSFDTSNVTDMSYMFYGCCDLTDIIGLNKFDTSKVENMMGMFYTCILLESLDLSNFDTSNVTDMSYLFASTSANAKNGISMSLQEIKGLEKFDTSKVTTMRSMFQECANLTSINLSNFDTSKVTTMYAMFHDCVKLESIDVSNFDTSAVTTMAYMFCAEDGHFGAMELTEIIGLEKFNTSQVTDMGLMFKNCANITNLNLKSFDISKVTIMHKMFQGCTLLEHIYVDGEGWQYKEGVNKTDMFKDCGVTDVTTEDIPTT